MLAKRSVRLKARCVNQALKGRNILKGAKGTSGVRGSVPLMPIAIGMSKGGCRRGDRMVENGG